MKNLALFWKSGKIHAKRGSQSFWKALLHFTAFHWDPWETFSLALTTDVLLCLNMSSQYGWVKGIKKEMSVLGVISANNVKPEKLNRFVNVNVLSATSLSPTESTNGDSSQLDDEETSNSASELPVSNWINTTLWSYVKIVQTGQNIRNWIQPCLLHKPSRKWIWP